MPGGIQVFGTHPGSTQLVQEHRPPTPSSWVGNGINPDIAQHHNLLLDKYDSGFDLISCRNVVIYFTEEAKDKLYRRFLEALRPGGVLFVGGTEAILNFRDIGFQHYLPFFYQKPFK